MAEATLTTAPQTTEEPILPPRSRPQRDWVVIGLMGIAAILLLWRLDNGLLWQDEAETALLARHTLRFGYPKAFDGRSYIDPGPGGYGPGVSWIYSPWLPYYVLAATFSMAGESTGMARLPFALVGLLGIYLTWRLAQRLTPNRIVHRLSVALLTFSVPFLLHMRQCRYYAFGTALILGTCLASLAFREKPSAKRGIVLGLVLLLLFHTNFGAFAPSFTAVLGHQLFWGNTASRKRFVAVGAVIAALTLPWALFFYRSAFVGHASLARMSRHLQYYVRITNKYLVPIAFITAASAAGWLIRRWRPALAARWQNSGHHTGLGSGFGVRGSGSQPLLPRTLTPQPRAHTAGFLILMALAHAAFLLIPDQRHMRYLIQIFPLLAIGAAWWLWRTIRWNRWVGAIVAGLMIFTNVLHSPHPAIPLADYADELTHRYTGPMEGIVDHLRAHARPGDVAKIPYDERTLLFYTTLAVEPPGQFLQESYPDWIIIRRDWIAPEFFESDYFNRIEARYERIELDAPDILWQNREDPGSHHFRTVRQAPRVVLYRKRAA